MKLDPKDTPPDWETKWADSEWTVDTLHLTEDEQRFLDELKSEVLPRHMPVWDWNLPFAEKIIVMMRRYSENGGTQRGRDDDAPPATETQSRPSLK